MYVTATPKQHVRNILDTILRMYYSDDQQIKEMYLERLRYVTETNPVLAFKQIGISRGDAVRIISKFYFGEDITMPNKELVNYIDFDAWSNLTHTIPFKDKYTKYYNNPCYVLKQLYVARHTKFMDGNTVIKHSAYSEFNHLYIDVQNSMLVEYVIDDEKFDFDKTPLENFKVIHECSVEEFDAAIESSCIKRDMDHVDFELPKHIINHPFTNVHVINSTKMLHYVAGKMRNCLASDKITNSAIAGKSIFVYVIDKVDGKNVEFVVEYKRHGDNKIYASEHGYKCNRNRSSPLPNIATDLEHWFNLVNRGSDVRGSTTSKTCVDRFTNIVRDLT